MSKKENVTQIKNDTIFFQEIDRAIKAYESKKNKQGLTGYEPSVLKYLHLIHRIASKQEKIKGQQKDYGSIVRVLTDSPNLLMAEIVGELSYYFCNILDLKK